MWKFVVDRIIRNKAYPNLARHAAEPYTQSWREFNRHWPNSVPAELIMHCITHSYPVELKTTADYITSVDTARHWYPVQFGFFNFDTDYIALVPPEVKCLLADKQYNLKILFYYHEGDDPKTIKERLDAACELNGLDPSVYRLVSGNTAADTIAGCVHFCDHELLYYNRNSEIPAKPPKFLKTGVAMRSRFLLLSRSHKWWRSTVLTDLQRQGLLKSAVWSYNTDITVGDLVADCPIELDLLDIRSDMAAFLESGPYRCDDLTAAAHNDHSVHVAEHYTQTACSIVLETHFDADGSRGSFLTEKTFKCIKHGHPFVLFAPAGSLATLRSMGYRTFDTVIDNTYDTVEDNTERYLAVVRTIHELALINPNDLYNSCVADMVHNQALFLASKWSRLNTLWETLHNE